MRKDHELFLCSFLVFLCLFLVFRFRSWCFFFVLWCFFLLVLGALLCLFLVFVLGAPFCLFLASLFLMWKGRVLLMVHLPRVLSVWLAHTVLSLMSGKPGEVVRFSYFFSFRQELREDEESSLNMLRPETPVGSARAIGFGLVDAHERPATCVSPSPA